MLSATCFGRSAERRVPAEEFPLTAGRGEHQRLGDSEYIAWVGMEPTEGPVPPSPPPCSLAPT